MILGAFAYQTEQYLEEFQAMFKLYLYLVLFRFCNITYTFLGEKLYCNTIRNIIKRYS